MIIQGSPDILNSGFSLNNRLGAFGVTVSPEVALQLMYQSSTTGAPTALFDMYGGYAAVKQAAIQSGYSATTEFIQNYEVSNALPESASTILNKQFIGVEGAAKLAQIEANLNSENAAIVSQARANMTAQAAIADALFLAQAATTPTAIAQAAAAQIAATQAIEIADALFLAQAAGEQAAATQATQAAQAAQAARAARAAAQAATAQAAQAAQAAQVAQAAAQATDQAAAAAAAAATAATPTPNGITPALLLAGVAAYFLMG